MSITPMEAEIERACRDAHELAESARRAVVRVWQPDRQGPIKDLMLDMLAARADAIIARRQSETPACR